ncbi:MAG: hypothetical protein HZB13_19625 [Acidobacteria bacterium]|nr:hypothetical protein [Acidobacteriota bacterium]
MVWLLISLLLPAPPAAQVEIRNSEVWLTRDGRSTRLTSDGCVKSGAKLSPSGHRIAYEEQCTAAADPLPTIAIIDLEGRRLAAHRPILGASFPDGRCRSILSVDWAGDTAIAGTCHINPSLSEYVEMDIESGRVTRDLLGHGFTRSPDGSRVAHAGWYPHFSPPWAKSNYLQADSLILYPLPKGMPPPVQTGLDTPPSVLTIKGRTYSGIHDFTTGFFWSPDSRRIAFVDCTFDWTADGPEPTTGVESNRRCFVAVVGLDGEAATFPLPDLTQDNLRGLRLQWAGSHRLSLSGPVQRTIPIP